MSVPLAELPPLATVEWRPSYRIVPSRFPPIDLFERVADPADLDAVYYVQALTNPRLREQAGELQLVAPEDRISGPGTSAIMAAFTHRNPNGSRFSDGSYGVYYASLGLDTAIYETRYHQERYLRDSAEAPIELDMRVYCADLRGELHDLRPLDPARAPVYDPNDYSAGQRLGARLRELASWGVVYHSVRHAGGQCAAVFRPPVLSPCRQSMHLTYIWDGARISDVYEKRSLPLKLA